MCGCANRPVATLWVDEHLTKGVDPFFVHLSLCSVRGRWRRFLRVNEYALSKDVGRFFVHLSLCSVRGYEVP